MQESEIEKLLEHRSRAIRAKNLDQLLAFYSSDVIYFDVVPPLQYVGIDALRGRFSHWFEGYEKIRQEIHNLNIWMSENTAIASMLIHSGGTLKNGHETELWVRTTTSFEQSADAWLITHEHVSVPVDLKSGEAALNLTPSL